MAQTRKIRNRRVTRKVRKTMVSSAMVPKRQARANRRVATIGAVKRIIAHGRENKMCSHVVENGVYHNSLITNADVYPLMPSITQGAAENQRIGDKIRAKGLYLHVNVSLLSTFAFNSSSPLRVRFFIVQHKSIKQTQLLSAALPPFNVWLKQNDDAGPALVGYDGTPETHILPINRDIFNVYKDITFQLAPDNQQSIANDGSPLYQANRQFKLKIPCPKTLQYDNQATGVSLPVNFAPFMSLGYCYPDNSVPPDSQRTKVVVTSRSFLYYEDA